MPANCRWRNIRNGGDAGAFYGRPATYFYLGANTNSLKSYPLEFLTPGGVASVVIPPELRAGPLWCKASNSVSVMFSGGFGLATTNAMTDFAAWAGMTTGDSTISPAAVLQSAGNITAWDAYLYGLDASHTETLREQSNFRRSGRCRMWERGYCCLLGGGRMRLTRCSKLNRPTVPGRRQQRACR